jgi:hypothetical protein
MAGGLKTVPFVDLEKSGGKKTRLAGDSRGKLSLLKQ